MYEKTVADTLEGLEEAFKTIAAKASKEVFGGKKLNIALTNKSFNEFRIIPFDEASAKELEEQITQNDGDKVLTKEDFDHKTVDDVDFYWKGISETASKRITDYIVQNGSFSGGTAEIYITKENGRYTIRFPVIESAQTDPTVIAKIGEVSKQIKDNLFADAPYSFYMTDVRFNKIKARDY